MLLFNASQLSSVKSGSGSPMIEAEFRQAVEEKAPHDMLSESVREAVDYFVSQGRTLQHEIAPCIELAGRFQVSAPKRKGASLKSSPGALLASEELAELVLPWVEKVRIEIFGSATVPFPSVKAAIRWVKRIARKYPEPNIDPEKVRKQGMHMRALGILTGEPVSVMGTRQLVIYWADDNGKRLFVGEPAPPGSPLNVLEKTARSISRFTFFEKSSVVVYILAGIKPVRPDADLALEYGRLDGPYAPPLSTPVQQLRKPRVAVIRLHSAEVSLARLRELLGEARRRLAPGSAARRPLRGSQHRLLEIMKSLGGEPAKEKTAFWERVRSEWNTQSAKRLRYKNWRGPLMAYRRLRARRG
jgi:hypothetical protein